jgi:hypothetical protein
MMFLSTGTSAELARERSGDPDKEFNSLTDCKELLTLVARLCDYCKKMSFPLTRKPVARILELSAEAAEGKHGFQVSEYSALLTNAWERLRDEAESNVFLRISQEHVRLYSEPQSGWAEVIAAFPDAIDDIEEMSKCFALERYTAAVFHSLLVIECGIVKLGKAIGVTDPKEGWDATCKTLESLLKAGHSAVLPTGITFGFVEQVNVLIQSVKHAWRNKVNHSAGKLVVVRSGFGEPITEEVIMATRSLMRTLALEPAVASAT